MKGIRMKPALLISIVLSTVCAFPHATAAQEDDTVVSESKGRFADIAKMEEILVGAVNESKIEKLDTLLASDFVLYSDVGGLITRSEVLRRGPLDARSLGGYDRMRYRSSLMVLPLPGFGALAVGSHTFADRAGETQNFIHVWSKQDDHWRLARAIGYGLGPSTLDSNTMRKVNELDAALFQRFNHRNSEAMRPFYATDVEFFHDQVGRTPNQDAVIATFRNKFEGDYVERHQIVRRELIKQSLRLFPIPGYGVLEVGSHRFIVSTRGSKLATGVTVGTFVHVIKIVEHGEQIKMALSYDHIATRLDR
jgi:hypothetical protein